ncbi:MAG: response regulator transcription factor [Chloroflexi bacterium]|nr:response regulator transcription factor [Chloroflexota bacterium]
MPFSIRIVVVSPRRLIRTGLATLLRGQPHIKQIGEAEDVNLTAADFDVALWDIRDRKPERVPLRFVALLHDSADSRAWIDVGASGIVLENASVEELLDALRQVARGETYLPPPIAKQVVSSLAAHTSTNQLIEPLTEREREVLSLLAQGSSNKDIAQRLYLSVRTVEGHLANVYGKLQVKSRTEAALWAIQNL